MEVDKLSSASSAVVGDNNGAATTSPPQPNATTLDTSNGTPVEPVSRPIEDVVSEIGIKLKVPQPAIEDVIQKLKNGWFYTEESLFSSNLDKIADLQLPTKLVEELKERQKLWKKQKVTVYPKREVSKQTTTPRERKSKEPKDDEDYFDLVVAKISEWHQEMNFSEQVATVLSTHEIVCHPCSWYYGKQMIKRLKRAGEVCNWKQHCLGRHPQHDPDFSTGHMQHYMLWLDAGKPDLVEGRPRGLEPGALSEDTKKRKLLLGGLNSKSAFKKPNKGGKAKKNSRSKANEPNTGDSHHQGSQSDGDDETIPQPQQHSGVITPNPQQLSANLLATFHAAAFPPGIQFPPQPGWSQNHS